jgi:hypothetical protein
MRGLIAGVTRPAGTMIDMKRFDEALKEHGEAVDGFDRRFAAANPEGLEDFKDLPRRLLGGLRARHEPLARNKAANSMAPNGW